jgi:hypothetical protein
MAAIVISQSANLNPTNDVLPKKLGNQFVDSPLEASSNAMLRSIFSSQYKGINLDPTTGSYELGDWANNNNGTNIQVNDSGPYINFEGLITVVGGVHIASGTYLNLYVNGTSYYINLLT